MASEPQKAYSPLLNLPSEIRLLIYDHLFHSTRLRFGTRQNQIDWPDREYSDNHWQRFRAYRWQPAAHSLAILRTCSLVHTEASVMWLGRVWFMFDDADALQRKLAPLNRQKLGEIRNLLLVHSQGTIYNAHEILRSLQLQLDTFVVFGAHAHRPALEWSMTPRNYVSTNSTALLRYLNGKPVCSRRFYFIVPKLDLTPVVEWPHWGRVIQKTTRLFRHPRTQEVGMSEIEYPWLVEASTKAAEGDGESESRHGYISVYKRTVAQQQRLLILSYHKTADDALLEQTLEGKEGWTSAAPTSLPVIRKPAVQASESSGKVPSLARDAYRGVLDYDWSLHWDNFLPAEYPEPGWLFGEEAEE